jgi:hypothetical protein
LNEKSAKKIAAAIVKDATKEFGHESVSTCVGCSRQAVYLWASGKRTIPAYVFLICRNLLEEKYEGMV